MMKSVFSMLGIKEAELEIIEGLADKLIQNKEKIEYLFDNLDEIVDLLKREHFREKR